MSGVIYARVPDTVKAAADDYANRGGMTLTRAIVELIEGGLAAATDAPSVASLEASLAQARAEKAQVEAELNSLRAETAAFRAFADRARRTVGHCPNAACNRPISGHDLLGAGRCPACGQALTNLVIPPGSASSLDQREVLMLFGALAAFMMIVYLTSK